MIPQPWQSFSSEGQQRTIYQRCTHLSNARENGRGRLADQDRSAAPALADALRDGDAEIRKRAAVALGEIGPDARPGAPGLIRALKDKALEEQANRALIRIGRGAVRDLVEATENPKDYELRLKALAILGTIGPEAREAVAPLSTLARDDKYRSVRDAAKDAVDRIQTKSK